MRVLNRVNAVFDANKANPYRKKYLRLHAALRRLFGGRYGTVELPAELREAIAAKDDDEAPPEPRGRSTPAARDLEALCADADAAARAAALPCVICLELPRTHAFVPCGHRCVCRGCAEEWTRRGSRGGGGAFPSVTSCPYCREEAVDALRIYE